MKIDSLTFFRFLAALIVVIFHYGQTADVIKIAPGFLTSGPQMVTFFFVLSGFVLVVAYLNRDEVTLGGFLWARFARISPVYFVAMLLCLYLYYGLANNNAISVFLHVTFLQSWFPPYPTSINNPAWSISVEAFFYLCFPAILAWIKNCKINASKILGISLVFWIFAQAVLTNLLNSKFYLGYPTESHLLIHYFPLSHLSSFVLGVAGGVYYMRKDNKVYFRGEWSNILLVGLMLAIGLMLEYKKHVYSITGMLVPLNSSFLAPAFLVFIVCFSVSNNRITKAFSYKPMVILGEASFAFYILQKPIHTLYIDYILPFFSLSKSQEFYMYILVLLFVSVLSYLFFERNCRKLLIKLPDTRFFWRNELLERKARFFLLFKSR